MIWALLAWFLFGASGSGQNALMLNSEGADDLIISIESAVNDEGRRQSAVQTIEELKTDIAEFEQEFLDSGEQLNQLYANHEDTSEEISSIFVNLNSSWEAGQVKALDARFGLRKSMTEDEWQSVFGTEEASVKSEELSSN